MHSNTNTNKFCGSKNNINSVRIFHWSVIGIALILSVLFLSLISAAKAATYYYISGALTNINSWKTNANGTGTSPASFLTGTNTFIVWNSVYSTSIQH